jgi:hypothetical protein
MDVLSASVKLATSWAAIPRPCDTRPTTQTHRILQQKRSAVLLLVLGPRTEGVTGGWRKPRNEGLFTGYHYGDQSRNMKTVFWNVTPCSLVGCRSFIGTCILHNQTYSLWSTMLDDSVLSDPPRYQHRPTAQGNSHTE